LRPKQKFRLLPDPAPQHCILYIVDKYAHFFREKYDNRKNKSRKMFTRKGGIEKTKRKWGVRH
jgi:hypothetical protein